MYVPMVDTTCSAHTCQQQLRRPKTSVAAFIRLVSSKQLKLEATYSLVAMQISADQLVDLGVEWVILGHSERRSLLKESSSFVGEKCAQALQSGLKVIACIGETLEQREAGQVRPCRPHVAPCRPAEQSPVRSYGYLARPRTGGHCWTRTLASLACSWSASLSYLVKWPHLATSPGWQD